MSQLSLFAQRVMSTSERFVIMPLFMLLSLAMVVMGALAIKNKRIGGSLKDRRRGHKEFQGGTAVARGVMLVVFGIILAIIALVMMIRGKTLLPG